MQSYNAVNKTKRSYKEKLHELAIKKVAEQSWPCSNYKNLYSRIYYFHRKQSDVDADNLSKPILDALKSVVFSDDKQVIWRDVVKISLYNEFIMEDVNLPEEVYAEFIGYLYDESVNDMIFIEVGELNRINLSFGRDPK
jgi:uncharacterized iron-regulated protein